MAHPVRTASRSLRKPTPRRADRMHGRDWAMPCARPVAIAVWMSLGGSAPAMAVTLGIVGAKALTAPGAQTIPVPVTSFTSNGVLQNIASTGSGTGTVTVKNAGQSNQSTNLQIDQATAKAIYNWLSFDIGSAASVTYIMPSATSTALNRVSNSTSASQIYGSLSSYYKDASGNLITGGEIYLINRNGILFGNGASVNVGGLMASALNMSDSDYLSGLSNSITSNVPTFYNWGYDPETRTGITTYDPATNYVKVDSGANITTASGGRVFLVGAAVHNAGTITTPSGQTVLAAGSDVYLNTPSASASPLYMSEANSNVTTVKGLLVEVNSQQKSGESATNTGTINTPTGNTTIVGWAVNQYGRINATTSLSQNGSVYLLARSGVTATTDASGVLTKQATKGGTLTLGEGSQINIGVDTTLDTSGNTPTMASGNTFTASRVELSGKTIEMQANATIKAPSAVVNVRAEDTPSYSTYKLLENTGTTGSGRITMAAGATIDVSGTTDTVVSVARNFVTTGLLGATDLQDAPLQKSGVLYRSKLTFDIRDDVPILGDTTAYANAIVKSASEFMATGGKVTLTATGSVVTSDTARIDVSGGKVTYTSAIVNPSVLVATDGTRYTLNTAPADVVYAGVVGKGTTTSSRFGSILGASLAGQGYLEQGYEEGKSAGTLTVVAPKVALDAKLVATTVVGRRQLAGLDARAALGKLNLGAASNTITASTTNLFGASGFVSAVLGDVEITAEAQSVDSSFWSDPTTASVPTVSRVSAAQINASGFGSVSIASNGSLVLDDGANLNLPQLATLTLKAAGARGITLGGNIHSTGGTVTVQAIELNPTVALANGLGTGVGTLTLKSGVSIDVSGNWVNKRLDGSQVADAQAGGSVTLASGHGLDLQAGSSIDVSGGATMSTAGVVKGSSAGAITLVSNSSATSASADMDAVRIASSLKGYGVSQGGSLSITAGRIDLVNSTGAGSITQGAEAGSLLIGADFLTDGGFQNYTLDGLRSLTVTSGTTLAPRVNNWVAKGTARALASGSPVSAVMSVVRLADGARSATNLSLKSSGAAGDADSGVLTVASGASINGDAKAKLSFKANDSIDIEGSIRAAGGAISATLAQTQVSAAHAGSLHIGDGAVLDVSGTALYSPYTGALLQGSVLAGGSITLSTSDGSTSTLLVDDGASLLANGATGLMDVKRALGSFGPAYVRKTLASDGGSIALNVGRGGGSVLGTLSAAAGNNTGTGGSFNLAMTSATGSNIVLQANKPADDAVTAGQITLSTNALQDAGFARVGLSALQSLTFASSLSWYVPLSLTLDAPLVAVKGNAQVNIRTGSTLLMGSSVGSSVSSSLLGDGSSDQGVLSLRSGFIELFGQQALKGVTTFNATSDTELRLLGVSDGSAAALAGALPGTLLTLADVNLNAQQVVVASASKYTLDASGATVTISGGNANAAVPLSAGGQLTINAADIIQNGVLRAPFGSITLNATHSITLGENSLTSVSGDGMVVPYGSTTGGGTTWTYLNGTTVSSLVEKAVVLNADGESVSINASATVDLSGGGSLVGYEFVPGTGGSTDIFSGSLNGAFAVVPLSSVYASTDAAILAAGGITQATTASNTLALGNTITFGANGALPAGTYAILPARYALLSGAYLVKSSGTSSAVALNYSQKQTDGAYLVGGLLGTVGSTASNTTSTGFIVMSSEVARQYSEIKTTTADTYFADKASTAGVAAQRLAADAGRLSITADQLLLAGNVKFSHDSSARGGQLDISSSDIHVGRDTVANALNLTYAQLNNTGAESIVLGGVRQATASDGTVAITVGASTITVDAQQDASGQSLSLSVGDLTLAAKDAVTLNEGAQIVSKGAATSADALTVSGNGALLRVSSDASASTTRNVGSVSNLGSSGTLTLGQNVVLTGGTVVAEATRSTQIAGGDKGVKVSASRLVIGAQSMAAGAVPDSVSTASLALTSSLLTQFNQVKDLTLRSYSSLDLYAGAVLGSDTAQSLTIDTANLRVQGTGTTAVVKAGQVQLLNTTGVTPAEATLGAGALTVLATGNAGGDGHITIGAGQMAVSGSARTRMTAAGSIVLDGTGGLSTPGDLLLTAGSLTATQGAVSGLNVGGWFKLSQPTDGSTSTLATAGSGAHLTVNATTIDQQGRIDLPSGELTLTAAQQLRFGATSVTNLAGMSRTVDGVALSSLGGTLKATSTSADITQSAGAIINVSAGSGGGTAGSMSFTAANGSVVLKGHLLAQSSSAQTGGSLVIDSGKTVDLAALANTISADQTSTLGNFTQSIAVRTRLAGQDLTLAQGSSLTAQTISLSSDLGDVAVAGKLTATSQTGGTIKLSAGGDVSILDGAQIEAHADAQNQSVSTTGGRVVLASSGLTRADGSLGTIKLLGGSIDTSGLNGGVDGQLSLRNTSEALLAATDAISTKLTEVSTVTVEAVKVIQATVSNASTGAAVVDQNTVDSAIAYVADLNDSSDGQSDAQQVAARLAGGSSTLANKLAVQAGVEIQSTGDLTLNSDLNLVSWRSADSSVQSASPVNLTLRAGGTLKVLGSISDGFVNAGGDTSTVASTDLIQSGHAGTIRLVGGADLKAADVLAVKASSSTGDVLIGKTVNGASADVIVRSTTGDIEIASGRDVILQNPKAVVYTTGVSVAMPDSYYLEDLGDINALLVGATSPYMTGGGSVSVNAARDVIALTDISKGDSSKTIDQQYVTDWWWRSKNEDGQLNWWSRYDQFQQGFATFGGGNVSVNAGRDAWNVSVSAAGSGYTDASGVTTTYGGGSVSLKAGRDITGGSTFAADNTTVLAGRDITRSSASDSAVASLRKTVPSGLVVLYGNGQTSVMARNDLDVDTVTQAGLVTAITGRYATLATNFALLGLTPDASLSLSSIAGDLNLKSSTWSRYLITGSTTDDWGNNLPTQSAAVTYDTASVVLPATASLQAGQGSLTVGSDVYQLAAQQTDSSGSSTAQSLNLSLLARDDLSLSNLQQIGATTQVASPTSWKSDLSNLAGYAGLTGSDEREPVRIVSTDGSVSYDKVVLTDAVRLIAGQDIKANGLLAITHQSSDELSLIEAGRDLTLTSAANGFGITIDGPGDLIVLAGRGINLLQSQGIQAYGNRRNELLPSGSANVTAMTGVSLAKGDISSASAAYFELLGGLGVGQFASDLYAQLVALAQGQSWSGLNSDQAKAFAALSVNEQLNLARSLAGESVFQQRVLSFMQHRVNGSLSLSQALSQFNALSDADKSSMVGLLLTAAWELKVPVATQISTALSMAAALSNPYTDQLVAFMKTRTGQTLSAADALTQFASLAPEEQALLSTQVLVNEMNTAVSKASRLTGTAKTLAYQQAYDALDSMFQSAAVAHSDLQMGASRIKTLQNSQINVFSPNGAVNVGQLTATSSSAKDLGLITAGGGNLAVVARDDVLVNQSRIFTVTQGDELVWSSLGNVDAGRGAKTVTSAASPVYYLDATGTLQVDVTSAITGSGIAASGVARIAAPKGAINASDAGISAGGGLELAATVILGADNISAPSITGAPAAVPVNAALSAPTPNDATASGNKDKSEDQDAQAKKRKKRNILLDFLGFGSAQDS